MGVRQVATNWQLLELLGKGAILLAVTIQLIGTNIIQRDLTTAIRTESEAKSLSADITAWLGHLMAERNAENLAGLKIHVANLRVSQSMQLSLLLGKEVSEGVHTETNPPDEPAFTTAAEIHEELLHLESQIEKSKAEIDNYRSESLSHRARARELGEQTSVYVNNLSSRQDAINISFALLFMVGSVLVLYARRIEFNTQSS